MDPKNIERVTALSLLLVGLAFLLFGLSLAGIIQVPLVGIMIIIAGVVSVVAAAALFRDSGSQQV